MAFKKSLSMFFSLTVKLATVMFSTDGCSVNVAVISSDRNLNTSRTHAHACIMLKNDSDGKLL